MSTTETKNLRYKVEWNEPGTLVLTREHLRLERDCFAHICQCPRTFDNFAACYRPKAFFSCTVSDCGKVVGFKVVERITPLHYHSFITAVEVSLRRRGIARQMSNGVRPFLERSGAIYLTKFCVPQTAPIEFEDKHFVLISKDAKLLDREAILLSNLKVRWKSSRIVISRVQQAYYGLAEGGADDAIFKAYRLSNDPIE